MNAVTALDEAQALLEFGLWELEGDTLSTTPALRAIYGEPPTTLAELIARTHEGERVAFAAAITARKPFELEYRIERTGGAIRVVHTRARPYGLRFVGATEDITERNERLGEIVFAERMQSVATLAGGLAHEINNPLAFISYNLDSVQAELRAPRGTDRWHELDAMVDEAREGVRRIKEVVHGISLFARRTEDHRHPLPLARVLDRALDLSATELRHRAQIVRAYPDAPVVRGNETRLVQVFVHLLRNAAGAIPEGRAAEHEIKVEARLDGTRAIIEISDTGHGIPPGEHSRIFDPFYTTKLVGGGSGLGLAICHGIVRSLGGEISVRSNVGAGTVVRVALPAEAHPAVEPAQPRRSPAPTRRGRVLIIDDEVAFASSLKRILSRDHEVELLVRAGDALAQIRAGTRYDAILCDLMMPEMTGMEFHALLLDLAPEQADRMILVTGGAFTIAAQQFLERLRTPWFEKPCVVADLRAAVDALVK